MPGMPIVAPRPARKSPDFSLLKVIGPMRLICLMSSLTGAITLRRSLNKGQKKSAHAPTFILTIFNRIEYKGGHG